MLERTAHGARDPGIHQAAHTESKGGSAMTAERAVPKAKHGGRAVYEKYGSPYFSRIGKKGARPSKRSMVSGSMLRLVRKGARRPGFGTARRSSRRLRAEADRRSEPE